MVRQEFIQEFIETDLSGGFFQTQLGFDYVGTGAIFVAAAAPRLPEDPPFIFGIDFFSFTVGTNKRPEIWESISFSEEVIGLIITPQELADAGIEFGDRLLLIMSGDPVGKFPSSYAGDVAVVPIPAAAWLLGSGLIGLVAIRKRFRK